MVKSASNSFCGIFHTIDQIMIPKDQMFSRRGRSSVLDVQRKVQQQLQQPQQLQQQQQQIGVQQLLWHLSYIWSNYDLKRTNVSLMRTVFLIRCATSGAAAATAAAAAATKSGMTLVKVLISFQHLLCKGICHRICKWSVQQSNSCNSKYLQLQQQMQQQMQQQATGEDVKSHWVKIMFKMSVNWSVNLSVGRSIGQSIDWLVGWLVGWLVSWMVGWVDGWLVGLLVGR